MTTNVDQRTYLQKYLTGPLADKKKKRKKVVKGRGFKIIDDDIDLTKLRALDEDELDLLNQGEDGPQIAGIIDERPEEIKKLEQFKTSTKWRVVTQDDGFNSKLEIEEIKKDIKESQKSNEVVFGKMYSDSEDENKNDSDLSPPRIRPNVHKTDSKKNIQDNSDSDFSPPRKRVERSPNNLRANKHNPSDALSRRKSDSSQSKDTKKRKNSRWEERSPINIKTRDRSKSPVQRSHKQGNKSKKNRKSNSSDSDLSPARKTKRDIDYNSTDHKKRKSSPPVGKTSFERIQSSSRNQKYRDESRHNKDNSVRIRHSGTERTRDESQISDDSDLSPPRVRRKSESPSRKSRRMPKERKHRQISSDLSPPRKDKSRNVDKDARTLKKMCRSKYDDSPPPSNKKMERTLDGKKAGLQDARQLRDENEALRRREDEAFSKMTDDISGRNASAVSRKAKNRETSEERRKQTEKAEKQKELDDKYKKWSRGLKQIETSEARRQDFLHEASKPLARHEGDRDLENSLKQVERDGDPMLQYIREKKRERGDLGPEKPMYKGNFPPNRFNIRPGYRWDGVDRSNGYEKKFFEQQSKRKAQEEEAYKWSTEDL